MIILGFGLRLHGILHVKQGLTMDESVTYLCSAGSEGRYFREHDTWSDTVLPASHIHQFYARPERIELRTVAHDLVHYDVHPPLYFWCLHVIHHLVGIDMRGGLLLNLIFTMLMLGMVYLIAQRLYRSNGLALAVCAIWLLSPAVVHIDLEARHYQLLGLLSMCTFWIGYHLYTNGIRLMPLVAFTLVNTAGFLTHYYYGFLLIPGVLLFWRYHGLGRATLVYVGSIFISLGLYLAAFPEFLDFPQIYLDKRGMGEEVPFDPVDRIKTLVYASLEFFTHWRLLRYVILMAGIVAAIYLGRRMSRPSIQALVNRHSSGVVYLNVVLLFWLLFTAVFFLIGISPHFAVGEQYFSYIWPMLALSLAHLAATYLPKAVATGLYLVFIIQLGAACHFTILRSEHVEARIPSDWYEKINISELLITPIRARGDLPRIATGLRDDLSIHFSNKPVNVIATAQDHGAVTILLKQGQWKGVLDDGLQVRASEHQKLTLYEVEAPMDLQAAP